MRFGPVVPGCRLKGNRIYHRDSDCRGRPGLAEVVLCVGGVRAPDPRLVDGLLGPLKEVRYVERARATFMATQFMTTISRSGE